MYTKSLCQNRNLSMQASWFARGIQGISKKNVPHKIYYCKMEIRQCKVYIFNVIFDGFPWIGKKSKDKMFSNKNIRLIRNIKLLIECVENFTLAN